MKTQHRNIKHKRLHINQRDQWATGADLGRPSALQEAKEQTNKMSLSSSQDDRKAVRFNPSIEQTRLEGKWSFLRYLLTLHEDINIQIIADTLEDRGVLSPTSKEEIFQLNNHREKTEKCLEKVSLAGSNSYTTFCEVLRDCGYNHVVDSMKIEGEDDDDSLSKYTLNSDEFYEKTSKEVSMPWDGTTVLIQSPLTSPRQLDRENTSDLSVVGRKMALSNLSKDAKSTQKEFNSIVQKQSELERQLMDVMKSLDAAKDALVRERHEKQQLQEQLKKRNDEIADVHRKYRDLQNAMSKLKETNNKFHDRITKLQIENEQLRRSARERSSLQIELNEKQTQIMELKGTIEDQSKQITHQESLIDKKLNVVEQLALDHQKLADGQMKLEDIIRCQTDQISRLLSDKEDATHQLTIQQRQLSTQQASIAMMQEHLERLEMSMIAQSEQQNVLAICPQEPSNRNRRQPITTKPTFSRPFNVGKPESSKNMHWKLAATTAKPK
ncbi:hypothetical protein FSP39_007609 [Pinctada imbricata]|uniref:CARD domain-containing protein n=1 Tax=Pinctada imbricata TaxID=66713 RepID=A0AA88XLD0_PINIB|nr:hypothetical protein FSP39_007609 [Pinctada imbricata]